MKKPYLTQSERLLFKRNTISGHAAMLRLRVMQWVRAMKKPIISLVKKMISHSDEYDYWDEKFFNDNFSGDRSVLYRILGLSIIDVNNWEWSERYYPKLEVGKRYWADFGNFCKRDWREVKIDMIIGIDVFCTEIKRPKKRYFQLESLVHINVCPSEFKTTVDRKYVKLESESGRMKITYLNGEMEIG